MSLIAAAHVWRLRGSEGSFAKPSTYCLLWTSEEEIPARRKHCDWRAQVLTAILFNPYEDKPTFSLSPFLGSRRGFGFIPGISSQLFSLPASPFFFYSDSYKSSLNGLANLKERKDRSFFSVFIFSWTLGILSAVFLIPNVLEFNCF
ncbi:hypothetical protein PFLUV_G00235830 [Perca fluviatilis]|uniref:Uncharacterized protein n=1 Tax=Perca fluviatilis TaxID=8168 RepID=A0A6A5EM65_PERFL|nr:hypothetical protein PFLUV_G00235830 [Perca fluviatilis]